MLAKMLIEANPEVIHHSLHYTADSALAVRSTSIAKRFSYLIRRRP